jgi:hypothetical protein
LLLSRFFGFSVNQANSSLQDFFSQVFKLNREAQEDFFCVVCSREVKHQSSRGIFFFGTVCSRFEENSNIKTWEENLGRKLAKKKGQL